ncbi:MAG: M20/M25/M40 family metallo-hydrolase [Saprospiraceae bacterium]
MKKVNILLAFLFIASFAWSQNTKDKTMDVKVDVVYLSSNLLEGRSTGTPGEQMAAEYIAKRFKDLGLKPMGTDGKYFQYFDFNYKNNPHVENNGEKRTGKNVVAYLDNNAKNTVVIGAHYDHLGHGDFGSLYTGGDEIHNGADDNASGVATVLYLAEKLKSEGPKNNNYLFIAFSGEEMGLFGSKYFVEHPTIDIKSINYMVNMDMVGRLNEEKVVVINGAGTSPVWKETFPKIKSELSLKTSDSGIGPSDHTSFYLNDIPAIHFFTGQHSDYHKPSDDSELVNYDGIVTISEFIYDLISKIDKKGKIEFTKTKDENEGKQAAAFKVTLGVMPDYVYQGEGMRIDGVMEGRPAEVAGMEKGDIVIKIGDLDVKDIYDYMEGLGKYKKGDTTRVAVKRGDKVMVKNVTF